MDGREIGGYFALELPTAGPAAFPQALRFQSARSAFLALLEAVRPNRLWMPRYVCDAMLAPIASTTVAVEWYSLDPDLGVGSEVQLDNGDLLVLVNYFGLCGAVESRALSRFPRQQIVLDRTQALFAPHAECLATIYSPRKFLGLPDGGLLVTGAAVHEPDVQDDRSLSRMSHLLKRISAPASLGYADFQSAEASLGDLAPRRMSSLTGALLDRVDLQSVAQRRLRNFRILRDRLDGTNRLSWLCAGVGPAPLCYPYWPEEPVERAGLAAGGIYVPTYWAEVLERTRPESLEAALVRRCLPLPCDQRYDSDDMHRLADAILQAGAG